MFFYLYRAHIAGAVAVLTAIVGLLWFTRGDEPTHAAAAAWVLVDVSGSTRLARPLFSEEFRRLATERSLVKGSEIMLLAIKGDPAGESDIRTLKLGVTTNNPSTADIQRRLNVRDAGQELDALLQKPKQRVTGSALAEGLWLLAGRVRPGDTIFIFSDGLQASKELTLYQRRADLADPARIERLVDELETSRYVADMHGVTVRFVVPQRSSITNPAQVKDFWTAWANRTRATLVYP